MLLFCREKYHWIAERFTFEMLAYDGTLLIMASWRERQRYFGEFHGSLVYIMSSKLASATQEDPVSTYKMKHRKFPDKLMCVGPWSPAGNLLGKAVETLGGGALLEELGRWERPELYSPRPLFVLPLSPTMDTM